MALVWLHKMPIQITAFCITAFKLCTHHIFKTQLKHIAPTNEPWELWFVKGARNCSGVRGKLKIPGCFDCILSVPCAYSPCLNWVTGWGNGDPCEAIPVTQTINESMWRTPLEKCLSGDNTIPHAPLQQGNWALSFCQHSWVDTSPCLKRPLWSRRF